MLDTDEIKRQEHQPATKVFLLSRSVGNPVKSL